MQSFFSITFLCCSLTRKWQRGLERNLWPLHTWPVKSRGRWPNSFSFWVRGEGRSPLKYIMFHLSARVWVSIFDAPKLFPRGQTLGTKSAKKCCHVGTLEAFHLWSLATSVKAQRSTSRSPPITLLDFLHLSIDRPSVKIRCVINVPYVTYMKFYSKDNMKILVNRNYQYG